MIGLGERQVGELVEPAESLQESATYCVCDSVGSAASSSFNSPRLLTLPAVAVSPHHCCDGVAGVFCCSAICFPVAKGCSFAVSGGVFWFGRAAVLLGIPSIVGSGILITCHQ